LLRTLAIDSAKGYFGIGLTDAIDDRMVQNCLRVEPLPPSCEDVWWLPFA
jgi:hypothetical protein